MQRMHPHNFGDSNFVIEYARETFRDEEPGFEPGGVKLVHVVRSRPDLPADEFAVAWREQHAALCSRPAPRARAGWCRTSTPRSTERTSRARSSSWPASAATPASRSCGSTTSSALLRFTEDEAVRAAVLGEASCVDPVGSFAMVVTERVVYDYTLGAESSPPPAVLDPESLEAAVDAQKYAGWNVPGWERRAEEPA